ncbi:MAG: hypothetical protein R6U28_09080 [Cyclonatronaceae bacterium]
MKKLLLILTILSLPVMTAYGQFMGPLQYYTTNDQSGLNQFEAPKTTDVDFDGLRVRIGGSNTLQFQGLTQSGASEDIAELGNNFNLATSNLDIDVQLHNGLRMHLRTYLSSRHHSEAWVKGGYLQVDRLDFIQEDFLSELMDKITIKVGHMQINYGDSHFRRTDNAAAIHNPFVGNYIMDSFTTEVGGEIYYRDGGFIGMIGLTNGKLNQSTIKSDIETNPSLVGKLGFDRQINPDLRVRLTGSVYHTSQAERIYVYAGDRAGSRYYNVVEGSDYSGRLDPGFALSGFAPGGPVGGEMTAIMINPFLKFQGLEFFGKFENIAGKRSDETDTRTFNQYGAELLYRLGAEESFYLGGRYNLVTGEMANSDDIEVSRINVGGGWFMTRNVLAKVEYVNQQYDGFSSGPRQDAEFSGFMIEAVISF